MKKFLGFFVSVLLTSSLFGCNFPSGTVQNNTSAPAVGTSVALTLAVFTQTAQPMPIASPTLEQLASPTAEQPTATSTITATRTYTPTHSGPTVTMTMTLPPSATPIPKPGSIAGAISGYPYGSQPSLVIVAFGQSPPYYYSYMITNPGSTSYSMSSDYLIPGQFQVVAYDDSGRSGGCPSLVTVKSEQTVTCDITDWGSSYPPKPSAVPNP